MGVRRRKALHRPDSSARSVNRVLFRDRAALKDSQPANRLVLGQRVQGLASLLDGDKAQRAADDLERLDALGPLGLLLWHYFGAQVVRLALQIYGAANH